MCNIWTTAIICIHGELVARIIWAIFEDWKIVSAYYVIVLFPANADFD